jgi:hypothetical protein
MMRRALLLAGVLLVGAHAAAAQSFKVQGGTSSVFEGHGGTVEVRGQNYTGRFSLGFLDGPRVGFYFVRPFQGVHLGFGDQAIPFSLPTDLFASNYYFYGRGLSVTRANHRGSLYIYAGATSRTFALPFLQAAQAQSPTGLIFFQRQLTTSLRFYSHNIVSSRQTSIQSLQWTPREKMSLAVSAGLGNNQKYAATSFDWANSWLDLQASYAVAGQRFRRVSVEAPVLSEMDRENVRLEIKPLDTLRFVVTRQNLLAARNANAPFERAAVNGASIFTSLARFNLHGSLYTSRTRFGVSRASSLGARRNFASRFEASLDYLRSAPAGGAPTGTFVATFREQLTPRWSFNQVITRGPGQTSFAYGGSFFSNRFSAGVEYQTIYQPFARAGEAAFRQVLLVNIKFLLPGGIELNASSDVTPLGRVRYTAYATSWAYRGLSAGAGSSVPSGAFYNYVVRGRVLDAAGQPVRGAALRIENEIVFTDSQGRFLHRMKKPRELPFSVALEDFMLPGRYVVVSAPSTVKAAREEAAPEYDVVLRRVAVPASKDENPPKRRSSSDAEAPSPRPNSIPEKGVLGVLDEDPGTPATSGPFSLASSSQKNTITKPQPALPGEASPGTRSGAAKTSEFPVGSVRHYRAADRPVRAGAGVEKQSEQRRAGGAYSAQRAPQRRAAAAAGDARRSAANSASRPRDSKSMDLREWAKRLGGK